MTVTRCSFRLQTFYLTSSISVDTYAFIATTASFSGCDDGRLALSMDCATAWYRAVACTSYDRNLYALANLSSSWHFSSYTTSECNPLSEFRFLMIMASRFSFKPYLPPSAKVSMDSLNKARCCLVNMASLPRPCLAAVDLN